jgi:hypothetical protein
MRAKVDCSLANNWHAKSNMNPTAVTNPFIFSAYSGPRQIGNVSEEKMQQSLYKFVIASLFGPVLPFVTDRKLRSPDSALVSGQINHPSVTIACMRRWQINAAFVLLAATRLFLATFAAAHCFNRGIEETGISK